MRKQHPQTAYRKYAVQYGFEYEIREASRCVKLGRTGSDRYTPQDSLALTRLMYDTRMSWGMKFAGEV